MNHLKMSAFFLVTFFILISDIKAQEDTLFVQSLTFDSITTRRGIWPFPEGETYRKILMYYTLKCDPQTAHDKYDCGEWDYLTYATVYDHTGVYDSTLYNQASYSLLSGASPDSFSISNSQTYEWQRFELSTAVFSDTTSMSEGTVGEGNTLNNNIINPNLSDSRLQYIYTAEELTNSGLSAGPINSIAFYAEVSEAVSLERVKVRMQQYNLETLSPAEMSNTAQTVFFDSLHISQSGEIAINFYEAFQWDGTSNILLDISFEYEGEPTATLSLQADETSFNSGISNAANNYALRFDGQSDYIQLEDATYFNGDFSIETWVNKKENTHWSRLIDFGNGPAMDNVIVALSQATSGKMNVTVYNGGTSKGFTTDEAVPLNGWNHIAVTMWNNIGRLYVNGEVLKMGLLQEPKDTVRDHCYIGRSNWPNDAFASAILDELRIFNYERQPEEIMAEMHTKITDPELYPGLIAYYDFDDAEGKILHDRSAISYDGQLMGYPAWDKTLGHELFTGFAQDNRRLKLSFRQIECNSDISQHYSLEAQPAALTQLMIFENDDTPTIANDTIEVYQAGWQYVYEEGAIVDSVFYTADETLYKEMIPYYGEPFEIVDPWEIGRFITPYGINLSLGPNGFTWIYDVTDYAHLLQGDVDFGAGNQQELIDVRFALIKGTAPRDVLRIDRPWGKRSSQLYKNLDDDVVMFDTLIDLLPDAEQLKMITRLTGHGHNSNTGAYPHCCEWKDNTHYLLANGIQTGEWHIWQTHDCGLNPVYPQGGTWNGSREGWCPGDRVKNWEFELGDQISNGKISVDYDITPVPTTNLGMGNGNYVMAFHLVEYGASAFNTDVEVYDVITPNNEQYYSRKNPICSDPTIKIRNNGTTDLSSLSINYGVSGGEAYTYNWTGIVAPNNYETIILPIDANDFWLGDGKNIFTVTISEPNGLSDEYPVNNTYNTHFTIPDLYSEKLVLHLKMNKQPYRYSISIKNLNHEEVYSRSGMKADSIYMDTLDFGDGCYTLELIDNQDMGLTYWAYPEQGNGYLRIFDTDGNRLKNFDSDFGHAIRYSFNLGQTTYIKEPNIERNINIYPNPVGDVLKIRGNHFYGITSITAYDYLGKQIGSWELHGGDLLTGEIDVSQWAKGIYVIRFENQGLVETRKIMVH